MAKWNLRQDCDRVVLTFDRKRRYAGMGWESSEVLWRLIRDVAAKAAAHCSVAPAKTLFMPALSVEWHVGNVTLSFDRSIDRLEMCWRDAVVFWKAVRQATKMAEREVKMPLILDDAHLLLDFRRHLEERYDCPADHARIAGTVGLMHDAVVGVPNVVKGPPGQGG